MNSQYNRTLALIRLFGVMAIFIGIISATLTATFFIPTATPTYTLEPSFTPTETGTPTQTIGVTVTDPPISITTETP